MGKLKIGDKVFKFEVGDKVRVIGNTKIEHYVNIGTITTVEEVAPWDYTDSVRVSDGDQIIHIKDLELVFDEIPELEVGYVVEYSDLTYDINNELALILPTNGDISLSGEKMWFPISNLDDDLKYGDSRINKIYGLSSAMNAHKISIKDRVLLWERKSKEVYYIVTGQHFGDSKEYSWLCDEDLFDKIDIGDIVEVKTKFGKDLVKVVDCDMTYDKGSVHREVVRKI